MNYKLSSIGNATKRVRFAPRWSIATEPTTTSSISQQEVTLCLPTSKFPRRRWLLSAVIARESPLAQAYVPTHLLCRTPDAYTRPAPLPQLHSSNSRTRTGARRHQYPLKSKANSFSTQPSANQAHRTRMTEVGPHLTFLFCTDLGPSASIEARTGADASLPTLVEL